MNVCENVIMIEHVEHSPFLDLIPQKEPQQKLIMKTLRRK